MKDLTQVNLKFRVPSPEVSLSWSLQRRDVHPDRLTPASGLREGHSQRDTFRIPKSLQPTRSPSASLFSLSLCTASLEVGPLGHGLLSYLIPALPQPLCAPAPLQGLSMKMDWKP